jgi:sulfide:quinone oxidoreductase
MNDTAGGPAKVLIAGGGIAGLEAVLALRDLAGDRAHVSVLAPDLDFLYRPLTIAEPFTHVPAETHELEPALREMGADFICGALARVNPDEHVVFTQGDEAFSYDYLVVCIGGRPRPAYAGVETFWSDRVDMPVDDLIHRAHADFHRTMTLVVPPVTTWSLPLYELALLIRRRSEELRMGDLRMRLLTPEPAALSVFGTRASAAVAELFKGRRISIETGTTVVQDDQGELHVSPQGLPLEGGVVITLPIITGVEIPGLPSDPHGFIPIDEHGCVEGVPDVYAAGDGANFPVKQGGIATQQADAAAEHLAARLGAEIEPEPFKPVLRGQLLTGMESLNMRHGLTGGTGEGEASLDYLWWPPHKVAGRYLSAWLAHMGAGTDLEPPVVPLEVEVSLPREWHETPALRGWY